MILEMAPDCSHDIDQPTTLSLSVKTHCSAVTPRAHARSGVKQSVLSVSLSVSLTVSQVSLSVIKIWGSSRQQRV